MAMVINESDFTKSDEVGMRECDFCQEVDDDVCETFVRSVCKKKKKKEVRGWDLSTGR